MIVLDLNLHTDLVLPQDLPVLIKLLPLKQVS
jgi:hypothetical protein